MGSEILYIIKYDCGGEFLDIKTLGQSRPLRTGFRPSVHSSTFVHIFYIPNGPSSEYVHEIDGLSSSTVHLRPSRTNNHGLSFEFVHEVDSRSSSGRPPTSFYAK